MPRIRYREGDWFAVPLVDGGYVAGVVARSNPRAALLGYFFGPARSAVPTLGDVGGLTSGQAILVGRFGHQGLVQGKWPLLGRCEGWERGAWPMPVFVRYEELTGRTFQVHYDDDDPARLLGETEAPPGVSEQGPSDGLMGAGFVERALTRLVAGQG